MAYEYRVPRNFKLLDELEQAEKGKYGGAHEGWITLGVEGDDIFLSDWQAMIIGPQGTNLGERLYNLKIKCGERYPEEPPVFRFVQKIHMDCVDSTGLVTRKLPALRDWTRDSCIWNVLCSIRDAMVPAATLKQPAEGATY
jgi:ubiquitin-conjugating enzyme E2 variant